MSYCVHCGVKLADYHETCPLCHTKVLNPNAKIDPQTRDYPKYREHLSRKNTHHMKRLLAGTILTLVFSMNIVLLLLINLILNRQLSWSLIPVVSLIYVWVTVAYPFFRINNSFFRLYTYDSLATAVFLPGLNFIISGDVSWAKFASAGVIFAWIIMNGIFISERVKKWIPMIVYYILVSLLFTALFAIILTNNVIIISLVLPIYLAVLFFTLLSFFMIKAAVFDIYNFFTILFINASLLFVVIDLILSHYFTQSYSLTWSLIVISTLIPLSLTALILRNIKKLRSFIAKKFHR
ncbi:MAG: hypothetical protein KAT14_07510 [Candidatus Marinimicrobia bacterium]|nr:hypothetical protein [Candidatus Neomarinimicrobiota bacterium]